MINLSQVSQPSMTSGLLESTRFQKASLLARKLWTFMVSTFKILSYALFTCSKAVKWNQRAVACDNCEGWYHAECMNTNSQIYTALTKPDTSWICCSCGIPNFSTSLFESFNINESTFAIITCNCSLIPFYSFTTYHAWVLGCSWSWILLTTRWL
jgi:hypothetical protein